VLHLVAFIVIGLVVGAIFIRKSRAIAAVIRVAGGLVGSLVGGFISLAALGSTHTSGKYGSLVVALVISVIVAAIAVALTNSMDASGRR
jgi:uncharacterized membrane protein YeaQ/YmgE (transglycosylase-associated protein family)